MQNIFNNIWTYINNSRFWSVIISSIVIFLVIRLVVYTIQLLGNFRTLIINKSQAIHLENRKATNSVVSLTMSERIELTNSILDLIAFMVTNEIVSHFKNYTSLNQSYDISNMDNDVKKISSKVYAGINKELFTDPNLILTESYLFEYITKKTISSMIDVVQAHNDNIRRTNKSAED